MRRGGVAAGIVHRDGVAFQYIVVIHGVGHGYAFEVFVVRIYIHLLPDEQSNLFATTEFIPHLARWHAFLNRQSSLEIATPHAVHWSTPSIVRLYKESENLAPPPITVLGSGY